MRLEFLEYYRWQPMHYSYLQNIVDLGELPKRLLGLSSYDCRGGIAGGYLPAEPSVQLIRLYRFVMDGHVPAKYLNQLLMDTTLTDDNALMIAWYIIEYLKKWDYRRTIYLDYPVLIARLRAYDAAHPSVWELSNAVKRIDEALSLQREPALSNYAEYVAANYKGPRYELCKVFRGELLWVSGRCYIIAEDFKSIQEIDRYGNVLRDVFREEADKEVFQVWLTADVLLVSYAAGTTVVYDLETRTVLCEIGKCLSLTRVKEVNGYLLIYSGIDLYRLSKSDWHLDMPSIPYGMQPVISFGDYILHVLDTKLYCYRKRVSLGDRLLGLLDVQDNSIDGFSLLWEKQLEEISYSVIEQVYVFDGDLILMSNNMLQRIRSSDGLVVWNIEPDKYSRFKILHNEGCLSYDCGFKRIDLSDGTILSHYRVSDAGLRCKRAFDAYPYIDIYGYAYCYSADKEFFDLKEGPQVLCFIDMAEGVSGYQILINERSLVRDPIFYGDNMFIPDDCGDVYMYRKK